MSALTCCSSGRASVVVRAGKCACGKTDDKDGNCDGAPALCVRPLGEACERRLLADFPLARLPAQARTPRRCAAAVVRMLFALRWCLRLTVRLSCAAFPAATASPKGFCDGAPRNEAQ